MSTKEQMNKQNVVSILCNIIWLQKGIKYGGILQHDEHLKHYAKC